MKIKITLLFTLLCFQGFSQNIYSTLLHDKGADILANTKVTQITTTITSFTEYGVETKKDVTELNEHHKIASKLRYNDKDSLESKLIRSFDKSGTKSTAAKRETWNKLLGYSSETSKYQYDENGHLIKVIESNNYDIIMREVYIKNNEKGHPISIELRTPESKPIGILETAEYDYSNNTVITKLLDPLGNVLTQAKLIIDGSSIKKENSYSQNIDLIEPHLYEYEYTYDEQKNWVEKTIYKVENGKRNKHQILTRKIKYAS
ncbi:hypothetical protein [Aquimarina rubra]|uniref:RHS repeat protein n=1 Tax=Aquimarina rubra TaxID=1920033 RepID=A0ABW5LHE6_9FLAO